MTDWTDDDGEALGDWVPVDPAEWTALMTEAGGYRALAVFSSLTDPDGTYGQPQIYTAWGHRGADVPLADIREYKYDGRTIRTVLRKFVPITVASARKQANDA